MYRLKNQGSMYSYNFKFSTNINEVKIWWTRWWRRHYLGMMTWSMTWMTPLVAGTSAVVTLMLPSIVTPPLEKTSTETLVRNLINQLQKSYKNRYHKHELSGRASRLSPTTIDYILLSRKISIDNLSQHSIREKTKRVRLHVLTNV